MCINFPCFSLCHRLVCLFLWGLVEGLDTYPFIGSVVLNSSCCIINQRSKGPTQGAWVTRSALVWCLSKLRSCKAPVISLEEACMWIRSILVIKMHDSSYSLDFLLRATFLWWVDVARHCACHFSVICTGFYNDLQPQTYSSFYFVCVHNLI